MTRSTRQAVYSFMSFFQWYFFQANISGQYYHGKWKSLSGVWLCDAMDYTAHGILLARILGWVAVPFSQTSQPRDRTQVSCIAGRFFTIWAIREAQEYWSGEPIPFPGDLPNPGTQWGSSALQVILYQLSYQGGPYYHGGLLKYMEEGKLEGDTGENQTAQKAGKWSAGIRYMLSFPSVADAKIEVNLFMLYAPVSFMEYFPQFLPWNVIFYHYEH